MMVLLAPVQGTALIPAPAADVVSVNMKLADNPASRCAQRLTNRPKVFLVLGETKTTC